MTEIREAFREHGFDLVNDITLDGKIHRFKVAPNDYKKSGWYVGYQNHTLKSGETFNVIVIGNFQTGEQWTHQTGGITYTSEDKKNIRAQLEKAKKLEAEARAKEQAKVALEVEKKWNALNKTGDSEYLVRKGIANGKYGIGFAGGNVYVPIRDGDGDGKIWSLQKIKGNGDKRFYPNGRVGGCYHIIGDVVGSETIYIAEGFATAASIHLATSKPVAVAFNSKNLIPVSVDIKKVYPNHSIIICGDDDKWKDPNRNPGRECAEEAAKKCFGKAIIPRFSDESTQPTDFNDLHCLEGLEAVKSQIEEVEPPQKLGIYPLGFSDSEYYFTSTHNRQIVRIVGFTEDNLLKLMPVIEYWEMQFPNAKGGVDWQEAKAQMIIDCHKKGIFDHRHVRGAGVWRDDSRVVVNMGDHLIVDGERVELGRLKTRYFYTLGKNLQKLRNDPLTVKECEVLKNACETFKWTKFESGPLLAGALVTARICGALPVRPHCWVTGGAATGKTSLLEGLIKPILGENKLYVMGNTTEAGLRQSLRADAVPVLFDEFETNDSKSAEKVTACIELMRAAWAESGALIVKGSSSGNAAFYQVRFSAIVSSIRTRLINDADRGRFAVLELAPHGSDQDHWELLCEMLAKIDSEYAERLFARTIKMVPVIMTNFKVIKTALARKASSRFGDQYGMLLAGYGILIKDEPLSEQEADFLAENIGLEEEREAAKVADHDEALNHFLTTKVYVQEVRREYLISNLISQDLYIQRELKKNPMAPNPGMARSALNLLGIKVSLDSVSVVWRSHAELEKTVWRGTKWSQSWGKTLERLPGAITKNVRIGNRVYKCVVIPFEREMETTNTETVLSDTLPEI